jgi:hypothetical protein
MGSSGGTSASAGAFQLPADRGYLAWTQPITVMGGSTVVPTAGLLNLRRIRRVPAGPVTNIVTYISGAGVTLTAGQCFAALFTSAGVPVGTTADQSVAWVSTGLKPMALAGGPYSVAAGDYYVGFWFNGTTGPSIPRSGTINANLTNAGLAAPDFDSASANASVTTTAPNPFTAQTSVVYEWWFALS